MCVCVCTVCVGGAQGPGVSHKIQQLLNTLKRPKKNRKPIEQYYTEDADADGMCLVYRYTCIHYMQTLDRECMAVG